MKYDLLFCVAKYPLFFDVDLVSAAIPQFCVPSLIVHGISGLLLPAILHYDSESS